MDLIYTDLNREDVGVLQDFSFDLAIGSDENNFELTVNTNANVCVPGCLVYIEGTEYGGTVDGLTVDTKSDSLTYKGRTWTGIMASKIITPDAGESYLTVSGEANDCIDSLITRLGLDGLFVARAETSGIVIRSYKMNRYIDGYNGIVKMLKSVNAKLRMEYVGGMVMLWAESIVDYSADEQFDNDQVEMKIEQKFKTVNHLICLGQGELADRQVVDLFLDEEGNISTSQAFFGMDEYSTVYENTNAESLEELTEEGISKLREYSQGGEVSMEFDAEAFVYDIGDIIGAKELQTGISVKSYITKKIVNITKTDINIEYKVGG